MKILLMSYAYPPSTGGIEAFSSLMRSAFAARGHEVRVVTQIKTAMPEDVSHRVERCPSKAALRQAIGWADVCAVCGVSLRFQVPALLGGKPLTVTHQAWQEHDDGTVDLRQRLKILVSRLALNIAVNSVLARDLHTPALTIPNPLPGEIDLGPEFESRARDVVFLGRLVGEKGVPVLLDALAHLRDRGRPVTATIVGDGPRRAELERTAGELGLAGSVDFLGRKSPAEFHPILRQHKIMAVPSVYKEAFGIVTLEGLAAGCMVLASDAGGLPEAVGPGGLTFPMGDSEALAGLIGRFLADPGLAVPFRAAAPAHLEGKRLERVAERYLEVFERLRHYQTVQRVGRRKAIRLTVEELTPRS
jgi:glycosyltransferase involved in cell wall biosynthesis